MSKRKSPCEIPGCTQPGVCDVPDGDGARELCWKHAHAVADHGIELARAAAHLCACDPADIFPSRAS